MKKDKKFDEQTLGGRLKGYEADYESSVEPEKHIVVRIDGHKFSKFTKGFKKPFDFILSESMRLTTQDLLEEFNAVTGYTQSDEITLIIPSLMTTDKHKGQNKPGWTHGYSGRIQKMSSLIAGFTTMRFNYHLGRLFHDYVYENPQWGEYGLLLQSKLGSAWFDCRIYGVQSDEEAFNSVLWRVRDAEKNSRSMFAQTYCSHKSLHGLTGQEQVQLCKEKTGEDWEGVPKRYKYGILVKKENYEKEVDMTLVGNYKDMKEQFDNAPKTVTRTRIKHWAQPLTFSDENVKLIMRKVK